MNEHPWWWDPDKVDAFFATLSMDQTRHSLAWRLVMYGDTDNHRYVELAIQALEQTTRVESLKSVAVVIQAYGLPFERLVQAVHMAHETNERVEAAKKEHERRLYRRRKEDEAVVARLTEEGFSLTSASALTLLEQNRVEDTFCIFMQVPKEDPWIKEACYYDAFIQRGPTIAGIAAWARGKEHMALLNYCRLRYDEVAALNEQFSTGWRGYCEEYCLNFGDHEKSSWWQKAGGLFYCDTTEEWAKLAQELYQKRSPSEPAKTVEDLTARLAYYRSQVAD